MKNNIVYCLIIAMCMAPSSLRAQPEKIDPNRVFLTSPLLAFADGLNGIGINGQYIGWMLQIIRDLTKMHVGEKGVGQFTFQGKLYSVKELRALSDDRTPEKRAQLNSALNEAKQAFITKILPFTEHGRGVQSLIVSLIEESCLKRNRHNCFLTTWGVCPEGKEAELVTKSITSLQGMDDFLNDLINFLKDLVYSCPKGRAQFLEMVKQKVAHDKEQSHKK